MGVYGEEFVVLGVECLDFSSNVVSMENRGCSSGGNSSLSFLVGGDWKSLGEGNAVVIWGMGCGDC